MVGCVAWAVVCAQGSAFNGKGLAMGDAGPTGLGLVLVDGGVGEGGKEIGNAADMIGVPVGEEGTVNGYVGRGEDGLEGREPFRFALARVDEEAAGAGADNVGVCTWRVSPFRVSVSEGNAHLEA